MSDTQARDRLGALDALFLYLEKKEMPLHIGSVFIFDGRISVDDLTALIESKLPSIPRYRQRVVFPPLYAGRPTWAYDPDFDIHRHIHHVQLKSGTLPALQSLAGRIFSEVMDRNQPLWDLTVVNGLKGGQSALIARVHHCLVDGIAGVALMNAVLDASPKPPALHRKQRFHAPPLPDAGARLADALVSSYSDMLGRLFSVESAALNFAGALLSSPSLESIEQPLRVASELAKPVDRLPFNGLCQGPRNVSWAEFPLDEANAIRTARGVKLNDLILAMVSAAVRNYMRLHRRPVKNQRLQLMVPVNLRHDIEHPGFGNKISLLQVNIPLDIADPVKLLKSIHEQTEDLKHCSAAGLTVVLGALLGTLPDSVQAAAGGMLANVAPILPFNMVCTNVPGPPSALYALGRKMLTYYPYVPIGQNMGLGCAVTSYNGKLYFGFTGDCALIPDLDRLRDLLYEAYSEMRQAAGVAPVRHAAHRPQPRNRPRPNGSTAARHPEFPVGPSSESISASENAGLAPKNGVLGEEITPSIH